MLIFLLGLTWFTKQYYMLPPRCLLWACPLSIYISIVTPYPASTQTCLLLLYLLAWIDWQTGLLPNPLNLGIALLGISTQIHIDLTNLPILFLQAISTYSILSLANHWFLSHRGSLGFGGGDIKLLSALCFWFDWETLLNILLFSCLIALLHTLIYAIRYRYWLRRLRFGPHLCLPSMIYLLLSQTS